MTLFSKKALLVLTAVAVATSAPAMAARVAYDAKLAPVAFEKSVSTLTHKKGTAVWNKNIATIQDQLKKLGYSVGPRGTDGVLGKGTRTAIRLFQRDHGLKIDGVVGTITSAALNERIKNMNVADDRNTTRYFR